MAKSTLLCVVSFLFSYSLSQGQMRVGLPTAPPDGSASLDISSGPYSTGNPYRGIAPPKVALIQATQSTPIDKPTVGLLVFNTTSQNGLTPGYYYWDGTRWLRFSAVDSNPGSARIGAAGPGGGQTLQAYLLNEAFNLPSTATNAPGNIILVEPGREGLFRYLPDDTSTTADSGVFIVTNNGLRYKRVYSGSVNVRWWGATGDGAHNDLPACQNAVNFAKKQRASGSGAGLVIDVSFPAGVYRFNSTTGGLNVTGANGIHLVGSAGNYLSTQITGNCTEAIFDFTGSQLSGCEGFSFFSRQGETNPAKIGVLFALGEASGGLGCGIKNCSFDLETNTGYNGGMGTIGIVNIRAEEFYVHDCKIRASVGMLFANNSRVSTRKANFTFNSSYRSIATSDNGSMGVVDVTGTSITCENKLNHGLILQGVNGMRFNGYITGSVAGTNQGSEDAAIGFYQAVTAIQLSGTIENYNSVAYIASSGKLTNSVLRYSYANIQDISKPVVYLENGAIIQNSDVNINFGNGSSEIGDRIFLFTPLIDNGDTPTSAKLIDARFSVPDWSNNPTFISKNLFKQTNGKCQFITNRPFDTDESGTTFRFRNSISLGNVGANQTSDVLRLTLADKATRNVGNAGVYRIRITGIIKTASYTLGDGLAADFSTTILIYQKADGSKVIGPTTTIITSKVATDPNYADLLSINADLFFGDSINIRLTPSTSGTAPNHGLVFLGKIAVLTDFAVNSSIPFP